jgi:hypothetical protein
MDPVILVVLAAGFCAGYAVRHYISVLRRRVERRKRHGKPETQERFGY